MGFRRHGDKMLGINKMLDHRYLCINQLVIIYMFSCISMTSGNPDGNKIPTDKIDDNPEEEAKPVGPLDWPPPPPPPEDYSILTICEIIIIESEQHVENKKPKAENLTE